ncbi:hypothetical protein Tco_0087834 [Tanacetum coccineum]
MSPISRPYLSTLGESLPSILTSTDSLSKHLPIPHLQLTWSDLMYLCRVLESEYPAAIAVSDVPGSRTRVHTPAHGGSEAHNELPDSILPN